MVKTMEPQKTMQLHHTDKKTHAVRTTAQTQANYTISRAPTNCPTERPLPPLPASSIQSNNLSRGDGRTQPINYPTTRARQQKNLAAPRQKNTVSTLHNLQHTHTQMRLAHHGRRPENVAVRTLDNGVSGSRPGPEKNEVDERGITTKKYVQSYAQNFIRGGYRTRGR